ncbi:MAG: HEAT repeat domain-containing protein [Spirochaetaceae bacterium]|nr:HEAT repeat domain-containing protein [Spirochaetaceae bacterium]
MKRFVCVLLVMIGGFSAFADEEIELYTYLYNAAVNPMDKLGVLRLVVESEPSGAGEFYASALNQLVTTEMNWQTATDREIADELAIQLSTLVGKEEVSSAAGDLWRVVETFSNPLVKAEAVMALGRMRASDFLPHVIQILNDLNLEPGNDPITAEKIAYGAILSLEKYQAQEGYLPVFFASIGWYSDRIKDTAKKSLTVILSDPTEPLTEVIHSPAYDYQAKLDALRTMEASNGSAEVKADFAVAAYTEGWLAATSITRERMLLNITRKYAMEMIQRYKTENAAVYPLLDRSYKSGTDWEERLGAVSTLGALATPEAARQLSNYLQLFNTGLQRGTITTNDERMVREVISALGATGQSAGRVALNTVLALDWTNAVKIRAREALGKLR